jgi:hypothetical protein
MSSQRTAHEGLCVIDGDIRLCHKYREDQRFYFEKQEHIFIQAVLLKGSEPNNMNTANEGKQSVTENYKGYNRMDDFLGKTYSPSDSFLPHVLCFSDVHIF